MAYYVKLVKPKKYEPANDVNDWYRGGTHTFNTLNEARIDAVKMYLKGWKSGISHIACITMGVKTMSGVPVYRENTKGFAEGYVIRHKGHFKWVTNGSNGKIYLLNADGSVKSEKKLPFGL